MKCTVHKLATYIYIICVMKEYELLCILATIYIKYYSDDQFSYIICVVAWRA